MLLKVTLPYTETCKQLKNLKKCLLLCVVAIFGSQKLIHEIYKLFEGYSKLGNGYCINLANTSLLHVTMLKPL